MVRQEPIVRIYQLPFRYNFVYTFRVVRQGIRVITVSPYHFVVEVTGSFA